MRKLFFWFLALALFTSCKREITNTIISGPVFGTTYSIQYHSSEVYNLQKQIDSLFYVINKSMSTYMENSDISKVNRNEIIAVDSHFTNVFNRSLEIYKTTEGAFDPTIGAVVNAWDFGPEGRIENLDRLKIDSLMRAVGLNRVTLSGGLVKKDPNTFLDFNAIAKGYAVDVIAEYLDRNAIQNYLVEIGGELRTKGSNIEKGNPWKVGVENPNFDGTQSILKVIRLEDEAMATSGTYRKFKIDESGNKYAHIIDTKTGYPSKTNLLSISVIADDCMTADAYATAFKAMGIENVKTFLKQHPELKVFLIFENDKMEFESLSINNFPENE